VCESRCYSGLVFLSLFIFDKKSERLDEKGREGNLPKVALFIMAVGAIRQPFSIGWEVSVKAFLIDIEVEVGVDPSYYLLID